ncbi:MAG: cytochrome bc1 complex diheme cytochrome c subunit [Actinomycetota bacterium]
MTALLARRRHPLVLALLLLVGLAVTGAAYSALAPRSAQAVTAANENAIAEGKRIFLANCSTCHGKNAQGGVPGDQQGQLVGPSLIGVGAAAVDFQVATGRMPLGQPGPQAPKASVRFSQEQIDQMAAYIASLSPGPAIPDAEFTTAEGGDAALGGEIFRTNCAMCHNFSGAGGALTRGKYAPTLDGVSGRHIYEAMVTGPQSMPVFNDSTITPEQKRDVIAYLETANNQPSPSGSSLGNLGPVPEGLFAWIVGIGALIGCAVWLGLKAA